jgi:hypothetical protein
MKTEKQMEKHLETLISSADNSYKSTTTIVKRIVSPTNPSSLPSNITERIKDSRTTPRKIKRTKKSSSIFSPSYLAKVNKEAGKASLSPSSPQSPSANLNQGYPGNTQILEEFDP